MRTWICKLRKRHSWRYDGGHEYHCRICGTQAPVWLGNEDGFGGYHVDLKVKP